MVLNQVLPTVYLVLMFGIQVLF